MSEDEKQRILSQFDTDNETTKNYWLQLIADRKVAEPDEPLRPGVTHVKIYTKDGKFILFRKRFSVLS